jgi:hypothetical protein
MLQIDLIQSVLRRAVIKIELVLNEALSIAIAIDRISKSGPAIFNALLL